MNFLKFIQNFIRYKDPVDIGSAADVDVTAVGKTDCQQVAPLERCECELPASSEQKVIQPEAQTIKGGITSGLFDLPADFASMYNNMEQINYPWLISTYFPDFRYILESLSSETFSIGEYLWYILTRLEGSTLSQVANYVTLCPRPTKFFVERATTAWCAIEKTSRYTGGHPERWRDRVRVDFIKKYMLYDMLGLSTKWLKFHFAYAVAISLKQPTPDRPVWIPYRERSGKYLISGGWLWCKFMMKASLSRCVTLQHAKAIMPSPSDLELHISHWDLKQGLSRGEDYRRKAIHKTDQNLDLKWSENWCLPASEELVYEKLLNEVRRTARELFKKRCPYLKFRSPSLSAGFEEPVGDGGQAKKITSLLCEKFLICSKNSQETTLEQIESEFDLSSVLSVLCTNIEQQNQVKPIALPEPLKVRMITVGPAVRYYLLSLWQDYLWGVLRECPVFRLTHSTIKENELEIMRLFNPYPALDQLLVSADYKAATDNLDPRFSLAIIDELLKLKDDSGKVYVDESWRELLQSGLVGATVVDKDINETYVQSWGQLMGSPISFPILCIVNAAVFRYAYELAEVTQGHSSFRMKLSKMPLLVNGDDAVCQMSPLAHKLWSYLVPKTGLIPSVGKNFVSRHFFVINSEMFSVRPEVKFAFDWADYWQRVPYVNLGLIKPTERSRRGLRSAMRSGLSGNNVMPVEYSYLGWCARELIGRAPSCLREELLSDFISSNLEVLCKTGRGLSWFLDANLGGIGLPLLDHTLVTRFHLKVGYKAYLLINKILASSLYIEPCSFATNDSKYRLYSDQKPGIAMFAVKGSEFEQNHCGKGDVVQNVLKSLLKPMQEQKDVNRNVMSQYSNFCKELLNCGSLRVPSWFTPQKMNDLGRVTLKLPEDGQPLNLGIKSLKLDARSGVKSSVPLGGVSLD